VPRVPAALQRRAQRAYVKYARQRGDLLLELLDPANWADPYPIHDAMRAHGPVYRSKALRSYVFVGFEAASLALKDLRFLAGRPGKNDEDAGLANADSLVKLDPPRHTQVRKLLVKGFSLKAIEAMSGWVADLSDELLDNVRTRSELDGVEAIAFPLPVRVISRVLGVPDDKAGQIRTWGESLAPTIDPFMSPAQAIAAGSASREMLEYFRSLVDDHRRDPRDDILSALIAATEDGVSLTDGELLATCQLMLVAGFGTSVGMIGNMLNQFVDRPDEWRALQQNNEHVATAVEEVLRYESPVSMTLRIVGQDMDAFGHRMKAGSRAVVLIGAANRDPDVFPDPHRFDPRRGNAGRHLAFSPGVHHCLGAALARLEGRAILQAMLDRMPEIRRAGPAARYPNMNARGMTSVPIAVTPHVLDRAATVVPPRSPR
jgi:cytochrome P450